MAKWDESNRALPGKAKKGTITVFIVYQNTRAVNSSGRACRRV